MTDDWTHIGEGFMAGVVTAVSSCAAWVSRRIGKLHGRIDEVSERTSQHQADIAVLQSQQEAFGQTLNRVESKQDRLLEIMIEGSDKH